MSWPTYPLQGKSLGTSPVPILVSHRRDQPVEHSRLASAAYDSWRQGVRPALPATGAGLSISAGLEPLRGHSIESKAHPG